MKNKINLKSIAEHIETFTGHLELFKKNGNIEIFKNSIDAMHEDLKEQGHEHKHVLHFFEQCKTLINNTIKLVKDGIEEIVIKIEHFDEILAHVENQVVTVQAVVTAIDSKAGEKMDKALHVIDKVQEKAEQVSDVVDGVQELVDVVTEDESTESSKTKLAAEEQETPTVQIEALPEIEEGGDELLSPDEKANNNDLQDLKDLPTPTTDDELVGDGADLGSDFAGFNDGPAPANIPTDEEVPVTGATEESAVVYV